MYEAREKNVSCIISKNVIEPRTMGFMNVKMIFVRKRNAPKRIIYSRCIQTLYSFYPNV